MQPLHQAILVINLVVFLLLCGLGLLGFVGAQCMLVFTPEEATTKNNTITDVNPQRVRQSVSRLKRKCMVSLSSSVGAVTLCLICERDVWVCHSDHIRRRLSLGPSAVVHAHHI